MKKKILLMSALTTALLVCSSCLKETGIDSPVIEYDNVILSVDPFNFDDGVETKLTPSVSAGGVDYLWAQGDTVGIYPDAGSQLVFPVVDYGSKTTSFNGGAWRLSSEHVYYAYVPFVPDIRLDKGAVPVSFRGQHQGANADAAGLRDYVFMSASGAAPVGKDLMFNFKRIGCLLWISLDLADVTSGDYSHLRPVFKSLKIYTEDGTRLPVEGEFDLSATTASAAPDLTITRYDDSWTLELDDMPLYQFEEFDDDYYFVGYQPLTCYMMVPPVDLSGKNLKFELLWTTELGIDRRTVFTAAGKNLRKSGASRFTPSRMENIISFEDKTVHDMCVAQWDTNGNGELEYSEAAAVTEIPDHMFANTSIKAFDEVFYFTSLTRIGDGAFRDCRNLREMDLPRGNALSIGDEAFSGCSIMLYIGDNIRISRLGRESFSGCARLNQLYITLTEDLDEIPDGAFQGCGTLIHATRPNQPINIPNSVRYIGSHAFDNSAVLDSEITLPDDVKVGPYGVFANTRIRSINIPSSWTEIGDDFFRGCEYLSSVTVPEGIVRIGHSAFSGCTRLATATLPESLLEIGENCFSGCSSLESIVIPSRITHLSYGTFRGCSSLSDVTLPEGLASISSRDCGTFADCTSLESITLPNSLSSIGEYTFINTALRSIVIPDNVRYLGRAAFERCYNLTECTLSQNLTGLDYGLFTYTGITTLTIPSGITVIKADLTRANLEELYLLSTTPPSIPSADVVPDDCTIYVPESSVSAYKSALFWSAHADQIQSIPGGGAGGDTGGTDSWD